jgi:hypothetical protein
MISRIDQPMFKATNTLVITQQSRHRMINLNKKFRSVSDLITKDERDGCDAHDQA